MKKEDIIEAYCRIRTIDNTIPDDVLDFMKESSLEKLKIMEKNPITLKWIHHDCDNKESCKDDTMIYFDINMPIKKVGNINVKLSKPKTKKFEE